MNGNDIGGGALHEAIAFWLLQGILSNPVNKSNPRSVELLALRAARGGLCRKFKDIPRHSALPQKLVAKAGLDLRIGNALLALRAARGGLCRKSRGLKSRHRRDFALRARPFEPPLSN